ncbi:PREDICTED: stress response protein nst1-like [Dufourea novaeangliae]|uniref:Coiled-coil domain-containing protein n=1 Tax=Dufourea novaeangliae TaxID=178035 RepID=A0A154P5M5_DUFNO|nr:PREDICTED: stress response protein nst1-like [Dufourea novaeangliae]KZC07177.1 hypothetical protein WN55_08559 [Dufourea novaeangliae]
MVDSDADRWYDWKRDNFNDLLHGRNVNAGNDARLTGPDQFNRSTYNDSQEGNFCSNGFVNHAAIPGSSSSGAEVRFINPAIYAETLNNEDEEREIEIRVKVSSKDNGLPIEGNCGDSTEMSDVMSTLSIKNDLDASFANHAGDQASAQDTYRCYSLHSSGSLESGPLRSKSVISCGAPNRVERRCRIVGRADGSDKLCSARLLDPEVQRFTLNGHRVVQVSTSSLSSISISETRSSKDDLLKKIPYSEWMRRKQQMARQKKEEEDQVERKKQMEAERLAREKEERESRERENFLKWNERKRKEEERKKEILEKKLEMEKKLNEFKDNNAVVQILCLRQWARKKEEEEKARQKKEAIKQRQIDEEKKKRLEESTKAYENWRKNAKNRPKPATQGLLPHQKAKPSYVNPTPWQGIVNESEDDEESFSNGKRTPSQQAKTSSKKGTAYFQ